MKLAVVRGKFLNAYEMQIFEPLAKKYDITAFGSLTSYHDRFAFRTIKLPSPMDLPEMPYKMPLLNRLLVDAHFLFELEQELKGFDIVHTAETYYHYTQQSLNAKKRGYVKKVIGTVLENIPFNNEGIHGRKKFKERARKELDHIIALTERTKQTLLLEGADPKKITVISHGINIKRFYPAKNLVTRLGDKKKKDFVILFSGRLETYKGVYEILYCAKILLSDPRFRDYHLQFIFIGEGSENQHMLEVEKQLGIEKFILHKQVLYTQMPNEYRNADIFIAPSKASAYWLEQYNTALLEAQASGLPIVSTLSGGIPENIGDAGILVGSSDFVALADSVKQFLLDPKLRVEYSRRARERAVSVHDVKIVAKKLDGVYKRVMRE